MTAKTSLSQTLSGYQSLKVRLKYEAQYDPAKKNSTHEDINKDNFPRFKTPNNKPATPHSKRLKEARNNVSLFGQLLIATQANPQNPELLDEFFAHQYQSDPTFLLNCGKLYLPGEKSSVLKLFEAPDKMTDCAVDCKVEDGAVV